MGLQDWCTQLAGAACFVAAGAHFCSALALTIELKDVAPDRVERQRRAAEGRLPLPGTPDMANLAQRLASKGLEAGAPVFIRIFKAESELELWMRKGNRFVLLDVYPICQWSGTIGPKVMEGDKQNPEGFYSVRLSQLQRRGRWPRVLNLGFPNPYDRALARTGSYILVHGGCSSVGCFAMTNKVMEEIYALSEKALKTTQERLPVHLFPFRMTDTNLERFRSSEWHDFWQNLKQGYDAFEATRVPPRIGVCGNRYVIRQMNADETAEATWRKGRLRGQNDAFEAPCRTAAASRPAEPGRGAGKVAKRRLRAHAASRRAPVISEQVQDVIFAPR